MRTQFLDERVADRRVKLDGDRRFHQIAARKNGRAQQRPFLVARHRAQRELAVPAEEARRGCVRNDAKARSVVRTRFQPLAQRGAARLLDVLEEKEARRRRRREVARHRRSEVRGREL